MRRLFRRLLIAAAVVVVAVALGVVVPRPLWPSPTDGPGARRIIFILENPIHTDIAIRLDPATRERFAFLMEAGMPLDAPAAEWLVFGWGGRAFYLETPTWGDLKPLPAFKALTLDSAVMHVNLAGRIAVPHPAVTSLFLSEEGFAALIDFIDRSFIRDGNGPQHIEGAGYGDYDLFFEATGRFNALIGCNTWTAAALRKAGFQTGLWTPMPGLLLTSLDLHN